MSSTGEGNSGQTIVPMAVVAAEPLVISVGGGRTKRWSVRFTKFPSKY